MPKKDCACTGLSGVVLQTKGKDSRDPSLLVLRYFYAQNHKEKLLYRDIALRPMTEQERIYTYTQSYVPLTVDMPDLQ